MEGGGSRGAAAALVFSAGAAGAGFVPADFLAADGILFRTLLIGLRLRFLRCLRGGLGRCAISFRNPLIILDVVERADGTLLAERVVLADFEALNALEFAEVGAVRTLEAEVVTLEECRLLLGVGIT